MWCAHLRWLHISSDAVTCYIVLLSLLKTFSRVPVYQASWGVYDAVSLPLQHRQHRQRQGMHPAPSFSGRAPPGLWDCRTPTTPGSASVSSQKLCGVQLPMLSSMLAITGALVARKDVDEESQLDCLQDDIPDQVATEDSDAAPGWEVPLRDVKGVTSVHVDVHNDLLWTGGQPGLAAALQSNVESVQKYIGWLSCLRDPNVIT